LPARCVQDNRWRAAHLAGAHAPLACVRVADRPTAQRRPHRRGTSTLSAAERRLVPARETPPLPRASVRSAPSYDRCGPAREPPVGATDREPTTLCL
jgi:hypothetical protein